MSTAVDRVSSSTEALETLRSSVRGEVLAVDDAGYDAARAIWNGMIDRPPAVILRCRGTADVVAGIGFAREQGLPVAIRAGGHNVAGTALAEGASSSTSPR